MVHRIDRRTALKGGAALGATALLGLGAHGAAAQTAKSGGLFKIGINDFSSADSLDPQLNETRFSMILNFQLRNALIEVGPGGVLVPELATEWNPSDDLTTWTFKIRQGVEFHNGKTLTAEDVVWSLNLHRGDNTRSSAKAFFEPVKDIKADGGEVIVTLSEPNAGFPSVLSIVQTMIVPADADLSEGIGTGGYVLESFEPGLRAQVTRAPNYWKEDRAHFAEVQTLGIKDAAARTNALTTGDVHAINYVEPRTAALLERVPDAELIRTQGKSHYTFEIRADQDPATSSDVRLALKLAIDRQDMLDKIVSGYGSLGNDQPLSPAYEYFDPSLEQRTYDPDQARALIKKAGASDHVFSLHAAETPFAGATDAATLYAEHARAAGINIKVVREPDDGYWTNVWGVKPFFASKWSGRVNEDVMLSTAYTAAAMPSGWNATHWVNEQFDQAVIAARGTLDPDERAKHYADAQAILRDDGGLIAPVFADFLDGKRTDVMHGELASDWELDGCRCSERWWFG